MNFVDEQAYAFAVHCDTNLLSRQESEDLAERLAEVLAATAEEERGRINGEARRAV